ncbi:MAG TPA: hypothetical protein VKS81_07790, partial [Bacteroidota bacterium]|nr:hypothetical protein [Bacteroidota bacterium]
QNQPPPTQKLPPPVTQEVSDTTKKDTSESKSPKTSMSIFSPLKNFAKYLVKIPFLDYETISIAFQQTNGVSSQGVPGSTGFQNFWRFPFLQPQDTAYGPSRMYQLGLVSDPTGQVKFAPRSSFPFIGWEVAPGRRAANGVLADQFSENNSLGLHTNRPLWDGATIELTWSMKWAYSKSTTTNTDSTGFPARYGPDSIGVVSTTAGSTDRTFLTLPLFGTLGSLKKVLQLYTPHINDQNPQVALASSFENGLEGFKYLPLNWTIRWDGLQKISPFSSIFKTLTLDHAYTSLFHKDWQNTSGVEQINNEHVQYGFAPLIGLTGTPKDLLGGAITGSIKYGTTDAFDLNLAASSISETFTKDISLSLTYGRHGFSLPFFGVNLQNDLDFTFTYSLSVSSQKTYTPNDPTSSPDGLPLNGTTRTTYEPRVRYGLSSRVTASLFVQYTSTAPDVAGATSFATSSTEAGVDISISITQ